MPEDREIERQFKLRYPADQIIAQAHRERTFLVSYVISQSYLPGTGDWTIRVRKTQHDNLPLPSYEQTLKRSVGGIERIELPVNLDRAGYERILRQCGPTLHKRRTEIMMGDLRWEIDVFLNPEIFGLELVEIELPSADLALHLPDWIGEETSHLSEYRNAQIVKRLTA